MLPSSLHFGLSNLHPQAEAPECWVDSPPLLSRPESWQTKPPELGFGKVTFFLQGMSQDVRFSDLRMESTFYRR